MPAVRTAQLVEVDGSLVANLTTPITGDDAFGLLEGGRR